MFNISYVLIVVFYFGHKVSIVTTIHNINRRSSRKNPHLCVCE